MAVCEQAQPRARAVRRLRRFAQQDVERQPRLLHGALVLRDVRLGRIDQAACLLQRHAVRHAVAEHRVDQCGRFAPQGAAAPGDRQVAFVFEQREVGRGDLRGQRQPHAPQRPFRGGDLRPGRPFGVAQLPEQGDFPRERRFDGVGLYDLGLRRVFPLGRDAYAHLGQELRPHDAEVLPRLFHARSRYGHVAVVLQRPLHEVVEHRVPEQPPPVGGERRGVPREAFAVEVAVGHVDLWRVETGCAGRAGEREDYGKVSGFHSFSSCFLRSRRRSKFPMRPTK